jgi:hypothetical protein
MKYFEGSFTYEQILYEISWPNLHMLSATIPSYQSEKSNEGKSKKSTEEKVTGKISTGEEMGKFFNYIK